MVTIIKRNNLSPREDEIMEKVTFGNLNKEIADD
jgi:FixJ family two-component response regulator